jgi:hypothetical protein
MTSILILLFNQPLRSGGSIKAGSATCQQQLQLRAAKEAQLAQCKGILVGDFLIANDPQPLHQLATTPS